MIIKDSIISKQYQTHIEQILTDTQFPWAFLPEVTNYQQTTDIIQPAFSHIAFKDNKASQYYDAFYSLLLSICGSIKYEIEDLYRIRVGCLLKTTNETHNTIHKDFTFPHDTMLYYVNDSDGDTVVHTEDGIKSISPKSGRVLLFDGLYYHASTNPYQSSHRFVITYNLKGEFYED